MWCRLFANAFACFPCSCAQLVHSFNERLQIRAAILPARSFDVSYSACERRCTNHCAGTFERMCCASRLDKISSAHRLRYEFDAFRQVFSKCRYHRDDIRCIELRSQRFFIDCGFIIDGPKPACHDSLQIVWFERLAHVIIHPSVETAFSVAVFRTARHGDNWDCVAGFSDAARRCETIHDGHLAIHEHESILVLFDALAGFLAVSRCVHCKADALQLAARHEPINVMIFDHEHAMLFQFFGGQVHVCRSYGRGRASAKRKLQPNVVALKDYLVLQAPPERL